MSDNTALLCFSGGLDTSFLVPFIREKYEVNKIITCTVNTGGFSDVDLDRISQRSKEVGADEHITVQAEDEFYSHVVKFLILGNVTKDGYPLSVGSERFTQCAKSLEICQARGIDKLFHGSTGAGNDQYRFDSVTYALSGGRVKPIAPVRDFEITRQQSTQFLKDLGVSIPERTTSYSYNVGLWGVSISGTETHTSTALIPDHAWYSQPDEAIDDLVLVVEFSCGEPVAVEALGSSVGGPVKVIKRVTELGNLLSVGRNYHIGTSVPGKKGRIAYEAPAAEILFAAHRMLERVTLTQHQISLKMVLADTYGRLIHEGRPMEPALRDVERLFESSQRRVSGKVRVHLARGRVRAVTADSPYNLLHVKGATYGEQSTAYSGEDARGACRLHGLESELYIRAGETG